MKIKCYRIVIVGYFYVNRIKKDRNTIEYLNKTLLYLYQLKYLILRFLFLSYVCNFFSSNSSFIRTNTIRNICAK